VQTATLSHSRERDRTIPAEVTTPRRIPVKSKAKQLTVDLTTVEMQLLLQSLTHCLATCETKSKSGGPCSDCDAAKALKKRLEKIAAV
jgi:hypothetical protein